MSSPTTPSGLINPSEFTHRFDTAARKAGFRSEPYGEIDGHPLVAYTKRTSGIRPRVYLSSGIHGDEPAPPLALLRLLEAGFFDRRSTWFVCPLLNPIGFVNGTRENNAKVDLNRDYKGTVATEIRDHIRWLKRQPNFDLAICVHEDWEAQGFYLYELNPSDRPTLANALLAGAKSICPIETATIIDGREIAEPGIIRPVNDPLLRETWPESIYLRQHHSTLLYTTETPSSLPLDRRIETHCEVLRAGLAEFTRPA